MKTAMIVFTRNLRVRDNPALAAAVAGAQQVLPAFVFDDGLLHGPLASPNRVSFLLDSLRDLDRSLRARGAGLIWRRGSWVSEVVRLAQAAEAGAIYVERDVSAYARRREVALARACGEHGIELRLCPGVTVAEPGEIHPADGNHFKVFSPFLRRWSEAVRRPLVPTPSALRLPVAFSPMDVPARADLVIGDTSPDLAAGGETAGRLRLQAWSRGDLIHYVDRHDDLAGDATSRISPYLHFGCLSANEVVRRLAPRDGGEAFVRQLCWRDFFHQVAAAVPSLVRDDYRPRGDRWSARRADFEAWAAGRTGYPLVDAGMRQLRREGFIHNRARMVTASFLVKDLHIDWRWGARHFMNLLVDGDVAVNYGNWQWVAGTGNDTRPNRVFSPLRQADRFDPDGAYVRRYVPELAAIQGGAVHRPWLLPPLLRQSLDYPEPMVDHAAAAAEFLARRRDTMSS